jgi:hypothetical protein
VARSTTIKISLAKLTRAERFRLNLDHRVDDKSIVSRRKRSVIRADYSEARTKRLRRDFSDDWSDIGYLTEVADELDDAERFACMMAHPSRGQRLPSSTNGAFARPKDTRKVAPVPASIEAKVAPTRSRPVGVTMLKRRQLNRGLGLKQFT